MALHSRLGQDLSGLTQDEDTIVSCTDKLQDLKEDISAIRNRVGDMAQQLGFASAAQRSYHDIEDLTRNEALAAYKKAEEDLDLEIERNRTLEETIGEIWAEVKKGHGATADETADGATAGDFLPTEMTVDILTWAAPMVYAIDKLPNLSDEQRRRVKEGTADPERLFQAIKEAADTAAENVETHPTTELVSQIAMLQTRVKSLESDANSADQRARDDRQVLSRDLKQQKRLVQAGATRERKLQEDIEALKQQKAQLETEKSDAQQVMNREKKTYRNVHSLLRKVVSGSSDEAPDDRSVESSEMSERDDPEPLAQSDAQLREDIKKHLQSTVGELHAAEQRAETAEKSYAEESRQCLELEQLVKKWTSKSNEASLEVSKLLSKNSALETDLQHKISILEVERETVRNDLARDVTTTRHKLSLANQEIRQLKRERDGLNTAQWGWNEDRNDLQAQLDAAVDAKKDLTQKVAELKASKRDVERELSKAKDDVQELRDELEAAQRRLDGGQEDASKITSLRIDLRKAKDDLWNANNETASTRSELEDVQKELSATNSALQSAQGEASSTRQSLKGVRGELSKTKRSLETAQAELSTTKTALQGAQEEASSTKTRLEDSLSNTKEELSNTKEELSNTKEELSNTKEELSKTQDTLSETKEELLKTKDTLSKTETEFSRSKDSLWKMRGSLHTAKSEAGAAATDKAAATSQVDSLSAFFLGGRGDANLLEALSEPESEALEGPEKIWTVAQTWVPDADLYELPDALSASDAISLLLPLLRQQEWEASKFIALMRLLATHLGKASHAKTATCRWLLGSAASRAMQLPEMQKIPAMASVESVADALSKRWHMEFQHPTLDLLGELWDIMVDRKKPYCYPVPGDEDLALLKKDEWCIGATVSVEQQTLAFIDPACVTWSATHMRLRKGETVIEYVMIMGDAIMHRFEW